MELRDQYRRRVLELREQFERDWAKPDAGAWMARERSAAADTLLHGVWSHATAASPFLRDRMALVAIGGYGRRQMFPFSDLDLLFLIESKLGERESKEAIRRVNQQMWDSGLRVAPMIRRVVECCRWDPEHAEFTLALLDRRLVTGSEMIFTKLDREALPKLLTRYRRAISTRLLAMTEARHAKYGGTLFHLEPNLKECPGGLRDIHVCGWLWLLGEDAKKDAPDPEFREATAFLSTARCFLHVRHERDDNILDWQSQDAAAAAGIGTGGASGRGGVDAAYWMRSYFRHARSVERQVMGRIRLAQATGEAGGRGRRTFRLPGRRRTPTPSIAETADPEFSTATGQIVFAPPTSGQDAASDPHVMLRIFEAIAATGIRLGTAAEVHLGKSLPALSRNLEEGPEIWHHLERILTGTYAGRALRSMHALGLLELLIPEFHGIDALVIRDAYHRYTVDEHTFVLIDMLHDLEGTAASSLGDWPERFATMLRDLPHASLLYMAALLHDTGKGRTTRDHAAESARMASSVLDRMGLDGYEARMVTDLIRSHLEMSAALRRDIFDAETVRTFAGKAQTPEALRMLTLFTFADIQAVHPHALTSWKAENLWRLYIATANYLDRSVDEERVGAAREAELVDRVASTLPSGERESVAAFLEGFPERYVRMRTAAQIRAHYQMTRNFALDRTQLEFHYAAEMSEVTLVTPDRPHLFADLAGALAGWGMNIVSADAFSNAQGTVVDSFRFTDPFRTLELNVAERERFVRDVTDMLAGTAGIERMLSGRRRARQGTPKLVVVSSVTYHDEASSHSTLMEVIAQDTPGLLRALSLTLAAAGCNLEVALIDTEGETAIDVFYLTHKGAKLDVATKAALRAELLDAMEANAR